MNPVPETSQRRVKSSPTSRGMERWKAFFTGLPFRSRVFLVAAILLFLGFLQPLASLMVYAISKELHSHIPLIPFVSIYLLWTDRQRLPPGGQSSLAWGGLMLAGGLISLGYAFYQERSGVFLSPNDRHLLPVLSFLLFLAGIGFLFLGKAWMKAAAFPFAFLVFMIPMPDGMAAFLESASQSASADAAAWLFDLAGIPNVRDGFTFALPGITIKVAQECSGIRSSWVLFITSLIAANMFLKSPWRRTIFVLFVIPLGVLRNGFRILVISWLAVEVDPAMIDHWIHRRGGPVFFVLSLIPLFLMLWWLRRGEVRNASRRCERAEVGPSRLAPAVCGDPGSVAGGNEPPGGETR